MNSFGYIQDTATNGNLLAPNASMPSPMDIGCELRTYEVSQWNSPPLEGWQAKPDGVVAFALVLGPPCNTLGSLVEHLLPPAGDF
jgi:hypothetical protein